MKSFKRVAWAAWGVLLTGCATSPTFVNSNSSIARDETALYRDILFEAVIIFVIIVGALIWSLIRDRARRDQKAPPKQTYGKITWAVGAAVLVLMVDGLDFGLMVSTLNKVRPPAPTSADLNLHVIGHRWWWEFDYPDLGIKTANELHIPVGTNVRVTLDSVDVIHSFWAPQLTGKTDAIPGQTNHMWLRADEPGKFHGQCSEFCGTEHALMRLQVIAQTQSDFDAWAANQQKPAATPKTEAEQAGYKIVTTTCSTCHSLDPGDPRTDLTGPNLTHLFSRSKFAGASFDLNETNIRNWVHNTQAMKPGNDMNITIKQQDLDNVVAYLKLLH
ncbi:MAG: cytochrome c oxidase subunit II [Anaerolineales bacterium]